MVLLLFLIFLVFLHITFSCNPNMKFHKLTLLNHRLKRLNKLTEDMFKDSLFWFSHFLCYIIVLLPGLKMKSCWKLWCFYLCLSLCLYTYVSISHPAVSLCFMWVSLEARGQPVDICSLCGSWGWTQVVRLRSKCFYSLSPSY